MSAMLFKKGDLVTVSLPKSGAQEYVIVSVLLTMSGTILGSYEAKAIGSDVSEYFIVWSGSYWSGSAFDTTRNELGDVVVIEDTDEYNFNNGSCNK